MACTLVLALGGLTPMLAGCQKSAPPAAPVAARQVSALGRLEPESMVRRITVPASLSGDRVEKMLVREAETVDRDQALAILSSQATLEAAVVEAQRQVDVSQSKLAQVMAGNQQGEIRAQEYKVQSLERQLAAEQRTQDQEVAAARARADTARLEAQRYEQLYAQGGASVQDRDRYRTRATTTQAELSRALENRTGTESRLRSDIASARQTLASLKEVRPEDVNTARSDLRRAEAAHDRAQRELDLATVRAPDRGRILRIYARAGERVGENGILEMADTDTMIVTAEVYQTDLSKLSIGQGATVTADGFQESLRASLTRILPQVQRQSTFAGTPGENMDQRVFEVRLALHPTAEQRKKLHMGTNLQVQVVFDPRPQAAGKP
ncbi:MAG: HlyD family efflux transporter periplasmic adaptor subunit [Synechococcus sp. ELA057]